MILHLVLPPRAVLGERVYRSRSRALSEGDGKNPAHNRNTTWLLPLFELLTFAFLTPSSFGPRFWRGNSKTLLRLTSFRFIASKQMATELGSMRL